MSGRVEILSWNEDEDGVLGERTMRKKLEGLGYVVSRWVYSPGTVFDFHTHDIDKIDGVLAGRFKLTIYGQDVILEPGDAIRVPRGASHRAEVLGDEDVVSLDAIKR